MTAQDNTTAASTRTELVLTRVFAAPRELVFAAWTEPEHLAQWWGNHGFTTRVMTCDLRPGGMLHYSQSGPNGMELWGKFTYHEVQAPERLRFTSAFSDPEGNTVRAPFSTDWPLEIMNTVTLTEENGKTTLVMRGGPHNATAAEWQLFTSARGSIQQGLGGTLDRLEEYLSPGQKQGQLLFTYPSVRVTVMKRAFVAPRDLVFAAMTQPEHVRQWYGLRSLKMTVCEIDLRPGGKWRFAQETPDGMEFAFSGVYKEVDPPHRVVFTECYEAMPGHDYEVTGIYEEEDGITTVTSTLVYQSQEDRDGHRDSGMESGANESYDRLEAYLASM